MLSHRLIFIAILINHSAISKQQDVPVVTKNGPIIGFKRQFNGRSQDTFLGIPFAQPPAGDLRFRKPVPVNNWSEPIHTTRWPNGCPHFIFPVIDHNYNNNNTDDDCLYLNVFSRSIDSDSKKPVLLFIIAGALTMDSSAMAMYDPIVVVERADVVAVTFNFRVNIFGFLYIETEQAPGNQGLYDQAMALQWVNDNIASFGGDPQQITMVGIGAGYYVGLHLLSPMTRNLFKNQFISSGAPIDIPIVSREEAKSFASQIAEAAGCNNNGDTAEMISCLKKIEAKVLIEKTMKLYFPRMRWIVTGDEFLPEHPVKMIDSGNYKKDTRLVIGTMEDEGSFSLPAYIDPETFGFQDVVQERNSIKLTKQMAIGTIKKAQEKNVIKPDVDIETITNFYFSTISDTDHRAIYKQLGILIGDALLGCPTIEFGRRLFEGDNSKTIRIYSYYWSDKFDISADPNEALIMVCPFFVGACEGHDLIPAYGTPFKGVGNYNDWHRVRSIQLIRMMASLARNNRLSPIGGVDWPSSYTVNNYTFIPVYEFGSANQRSGFRYNIKDLECQMIWKF